MQVLETPPSRPASPASAFVTPESRESQIFSSSTPLDEVGFLGGPGLPSVTLRLPALESIGDKATVLADTLDDNGNILQIDFTFEKVGDNIIRVLADRPGTGGAFFSNFDIFLDDSGIILGFDTNLNGRIDAVTPPTISVSTGFFDFLPLKVQLNLLPLGGNGGLREEEIAAFLRPPLSLNTMLSAQTSPDTS